MPHAGRVSFQYHTETYQLKQKYPNDWNTQFLQLFDSLLPKQTQETHVSCVWHSLSSRNMGSRNQWNAIVGNSWAATWKLAAIPFPHNDIFHPRLMALKVAGIFQYLL